MVKPNARRSTVGIWGQSASGAALKWVVTVGSPTGLTTGEAGHFAATALSSLNACADPSTLEYRTASVLNRLLPWLSRATTCKRAVRCDSLGNVPLHRSSVGCPLTWLPPVRSRTL